jgi:hypothetical protein
VQVKNMPNGHDGRNGQPLKGSLRRNVSELVSDVAAMAELQLKLLVVDLGSAWAHARWPLLVCSGGVVLLVGAVPVLLLGGAEALLEAGWSRWGAYLLIGAVAAAIALALVRIGAARLSGASGEFTRSRREWNENIAWVRRVMSERQHADPPRPKVVRANVDLNPSEPGETQ